MAKPEMLTDEELLRVVGVFVGLGVRQVRLTGGEPLLRRSLPAVVARHRRMSPAPPDRDDHQRHRPGPARRPAGRGGPRPGQREPRHGRPQRLPVPDPARPVRRRRARAQGRGVGRAHAGQGQRRRDARASTTAPSPTCCSGASTAATTCASSSRCRWTPSTPGTASRWSPPTRCAPGSSERFTLTPMPDDARGSAPAELFLVDGGPATVGIIASVSAPFCAACDRVRLTADGQVRNCLFAQRRGRPARAAARRAPPTTSSPP